VTASCAAAASIIPAAISARTASAAAASWICPENGLRLGGPGAGRDDAEHRGRLGLLRLRDHRRGLLHRGDLGSDSPADISGQEVVTDQRTARSSDGVGKQPGPQVLDQQEGHRAARLKGVRHVLHGSHAGARRPAGRPIPGR
jgi:hypothetical protein